MSVVWRRGVKAPPVVFNQPAKGCCASGRGGKDASVVVMYGSGVMGLCAVGVALEAGVRAASE